MSDPARFRAGLLFGLVAYTWWGLIPLYFRQLAGVDLGEILAARVAFSVVVLGVVVALTGGGEAIRAALRNRRAVLTLLLSAGLLAVNWLLYIAATLWGRVVDASLGYYMLPLVNAVLATAFLGERLRPAHYPALALVGVAVLVPAVWLGLVPWIGVTLAVTFGLYGLVRKLVRVDAFAGLAVETVLMLPFAVAYLFYLSMTGDIKLGQDAVMTATLAASGVVTVIPLLTFALAVRRLPLLALNLIQVLSPTLQVVVAVTWLEQDVPDAMWVALGCVLAGVGLFIADAAAQAAAGRPAVEQGPVAEADAVEARVG